LMLNRKYMSLKSVFKKSIESLPYISTLARYKSYQKVPPGHFYSPIVLPSEAEKYKSRIFSIPDQLPGIEMNTTTQLKMLEEFRKFYPEIPKGWDTGGLRYQFDNKFYSYSDAIFLYSMMRYVKPKRVIEIGSGFSSALMLDTNEIFFNNTIDLTFIEPYPKRLNSLLGDKKDITLIEKPLQEVDLSVFSKLEADDILFIDSTHVSKTGSDVNIILFEILPLLKKGVKIHFHDIFYPFEYPAVWVLQTGRNWNEAYALRSFLSFNSSFQIFFFNTYLEFFHKPWFELNMPLCMKNTGGSLWIECNNQKELLV
jgi:predicted O-methyltransferase YrrM